MSRNLVCKLTVTEVGQTSRHASTEHNEDPNGKYVSEQLKLAAHYDDGKEINKLWSHWTPSAEFNMQIDNPSAQGVFRPGDVVYVTLSDSPPEGIEG